MKVPSTKHPVIVPAARMPSRCIVVRCDARARVVATALERCYIAVPLRDAAMAKTCNYCGKGRHKAHSVSHSNIKTRKWQQPNLQSVRALIEGQVQKMTVCTRCIRSGKVVKAA